ncbi:MAG TPA: isoprenylcysteine carboxylmethyltransferase family protein [Stellaceae bacterium]|nr:isoprenylcysteine carboxylmethyltransferase family protein [Stellaceae bacterium]
MTGSHDPIGLIPALWLAWAAYWIVAARSVKPTRWREPAGSLARHVIPMLLCAALLAAPRAFPPALRTRFAPPGRLLPLIGALCVAAGLGLAVWARHHLGRNWSGIVTLKEGHALVRTGPYRWVRHPIYTGLLLALVGTALAIGEWRGVLAVACALLAFLWKIRVEEAHMRRAFPEYDAYRRRSAALIPLLY